MSSAQTKCFRGVTHVIFDNDGTLMDTDHLYQEAIQSLLAPYGHTYTFELKVRCIGLPALLSARLLIAELNLPINVTEFIRQYRNELARLAWNVNLLPGVKDLLLHFHDHRVPMAIATSSVRGAFDYKARPHRNLMPAIHHIVCSDDPELKRGKPSPDIFLLAASRFKPQPCPCCCLVFEDSPAGLQAGLAAGMQVVMIPDPRVPPEKLKGASLVLRSIADFEPELFGLPPYDNCCKFTFG